MLRADATAEPPAPTFPGYRVTGTLGKGGFGMVYRAEGSAGAVAIKTTHRGEAVAETRLRREAAALQAIGPPHVPRLYESGQLPDGTAYVVMELVALPTLAERMADRSAMPVEEALAVARGILVALQAAHVHGLVHRDLKPENVFIGERGAKLVDFGLVKQLGQRSDEHLTSAGTVMGSFLYMSPEQSAAKPDIDGRSDIYSFGVILYELLAGRPPFLGSNAEVLQAHLARRPPRLATLVAVPPSVEALTHRCLAKLREERFASIAEVLAALDNAAGRAAAERLEDTLVVTRSRLAPAKGAAPAGAQTREKRTAGLLFFRSGREAKAVHDFVASFGGHLARADGAYAVVFDHDAGDNPARRALLAAQGLVDGQYAAAAVVDTAAVTVMPRPDGSRRYVSPLFTKEDSFPAASGPDGVLLTAHSGELLVDVEKQPIGERGLLLVARGTAASGPEAGGLLAATIGRDAALDRVVQTARQAVLGSPSIVTVVGELGLGKSHFLAAVAERLQQVVPELEILSLKASRDGVGGHGGGTLKDLLRLALQLPLATPTDAGRGVLAERLGFALAEELWPGVAVAVGWAGNTDPEVQALAAAPGALRSAATRALAMGLRGRASARPLVILLDDAHLADDATLDALELATLAEAEAPLLVCVGARSSLLETRSSWGGRAGAQQQVQLAPLEPTHGAELLRRLLLPAEDVSAQVIDRLVARTYGNPMLLAELARGLKREGLVRPQAKGAGWYLASDALEALPNLPLVEWLATREVAALSPELARHARLLSLLGGAFTTAEVAGILAVLDGAGLGAEFPLDAAVAIGRLVDCGLLVEASEGRQLGFRSAVVREAIERSIPAPLLGPIHEAAYRYYMSVDDRDTRPAVAHHAARCGHYTESFDTYLSLARETEARHAYLDAEIFCGRALEVRGHGETPADLVHAFRHRGMIRYRLARYDDAVADFKLARELARQLGDIATEIEIDLDEATVLDWLDELHASRAFAEKARALADQIPGGPAPLLEARLCLALGRSACRFSDDVEAARLVLEAAERCEKLGDEAYETYVISLFFGAFILANLGRLDESEALFDKAIPLAVSRQDQLHVSAALACRNVLWGARNLPERALADLDRLAVIAREIGNPHVEANAEGLRAVSLQWLGRPIEAEEHARRALELHDRRMGASARLEFRVLLARILAVRGDLEAAGRVLDEVRMRQEEARALGSTHGELLPSEEVFRTLAMLLVHGGSADDWKALAESARRYTNNLDQAEVLRIAAAHVAS